MISNLKDIDNLTLIEFNENDVPPEVLLILNENQNFKVSKVFGDKSLGMPLEYEKLILEDNGGVKTFEYYNKGIHFGLYGKENEQPVFKVFTHFMIETRNNEK